MFSSLNKQLIFKEIQSITTSMAHKVPVVGRMLVDEQKLRNDILEEGKNVDD